MNSNDNQQKRPFWVWVITIFNAVVLLFLAFGAYAIWSNKIPLSPAQSAYFEKMTLLQHIVSGLIGIGNLAGTVSLFLLRKSALPFFLSVLSLNAAMPVWHILARDDFIPLAGWGPIIFSLLGNLAIFLYVARLSGKGILT